VGAHLCKIYYILMYFISVIVNRLRTFLMSIVAILFNEDRRTIITFLQKERIKQKKIFLLNKTTPKMLDYNTYIITKPINWI